MTQCISLRIFFIAAIAALLLANCTTRESKTYDGWPVVGGNAEGNKYSSLDQIDTANVKQLQIAWTYHAGDVDTAAHSQIQCNPIIVDGILYGTSPKLKLFALDAATGTEKWAYAPLDTIEGDKGAHFNLNNNRGVAYWTDNKGDSRIFYAVGPHMHAVDAETGKLITSFADSGKLDL
ncbi:MAG TPA: pyrroloquinoline quinone-dependent dehydrogenase, partial [Ohtaekwangia sp.]|nr:pyrroloquinoline quinone-dependent dehydrogenase [Ohtaekwangia sp.]